MKDANDDGLAVAKDVSDFFECETGTEDEFRGQYQRLHHAQDSVVAPAVPAAAPATASTVVLSAGDTKVTVPEKDYVDMLGEHGLVPPADGTHSALAILWLAQSAQKRGLVRLSKDLMDLRNVGRGLVVVRRPDGAFYTPKTITVIKLARAEEEQRATAADVEAFFADHEAARR